MSADKVRKVRLSNKLCPNIGLMTPFPTMTPYYCKALETLRLERVGCGSGGLAMKKNKKPQDLSPYLRSVSLGFDDPDLVRDGVSNQLWRGGVRS